MAKATKGSADPRAAAESLSTGDHTTATARRALQSAARSAAGANPPSGTTAARPPDPGESQGPPAKPSATTAAAAGGPAIVPARGANGRFAPRPSGDRVAAATSSNRRPTT